MAQVAYLVGCKKTHLDHQLTDDVGQAGLAGARWALKDHVVQRLVFFAFFARLLPDLVQLNLLVKLPQLLLDGLVPDDVVELTCNPRINKQERADIGFSCLLVINSSTVILSSAAFFFSAALKSLPPKRLLADSSSSLGLPRGLPLIPGKATKEKPRKRK